jgi:hypothetical protein
MLKANKETSKTKKGVSSKVKKENKPIEADNKDDFFIIEKWIDEFGCTYYCSSDPEANSYLLGPGETYGNFVAA